MDKRVQTMVRECVGRELVDPAGDQIGTIVSVFVDDRSGQPEWLAVRTGWFGDHESFVPIRGIDVSGSDVRSLYSKDTVKDAPHVAPNGHLTPDEQRELFDYYEINDVVTDPAGAPDPNRSEVVPDPTNQPLTPSDRLRNDSGDVPLAGGRPAPERPHDG